MRPYGLFQPENTAAREPTAAERAVGDARDGLDRRRASGRSRTPASTSSPAPAATPVVLECELAEPSLFLATSAGAADRLARAVADKIC